MATTLTDLHPDIIQTHILPRVDGRSLSTVTTVSSDLHTSCSDHNLWSRICMCMWPSITHPRLHDVISTFPNRHRSFFHDAFPSLNLITAVSHCCLSQPDNSILNGSILISAVDIQYKTDIIYSTVHFTDVTTDFLSSELLVKLTGDHVVASVVVDKSTFTTTPKGLAHLKELMTLNWIIIDPTLKRAGNLSTIKPVTVKRDWVSNKIIVKYVTVLPGCDVDEMVQCRIQVVLGVGLQVKEVTMKVLNIDSCWLSGREFLVILRRVVFGGNKVRRKVVLDKERLERRREFKELKRRRWELTRKEEEKMKSELMMDYVGMFVLFCVFIYVLSLVLSTIKHLKQCL